MTAADSAAPEPRLLGIGAEAPERRFLTIVFVDMVGYTTLSEQLDEEDLGLLQTRYQELARSIIERYGGFVARFLGDGILAYFGYPRAHERDAERALLAALELQRRVTDLDTEIQGTRLAPLSLRIGVHSGHVVMAPEALSVETSVPGAVGDAANLAARLQTEAPPGGILVSQETLELVDGVFDYESLGSRPMKGLSREVPVFRILRATRASHGLSSRLQRGATRMVGREAAIERLLERWKSTKESAGCECVVVAGEAGVGKTRLLLEFLRLPEAADARHLQATCQEIYARTPLHPVGNLLWSQAGIASESTDIECTRKVATFLDGLGFNTEHNMQIVASLFGFTGARGTDVVAPTPQLLKRQQYEFVVAILVKLAQGRPTILWVEDANWLDPSSAELLSEIVVATKSLPLLIVLTLRSLRQGPALPNVTEVIDLEQLGARDCLEVARSVPGADALSDEVVQRAVEAADGIPLFLEQLVISLLDERIDTSGRAQRRTGMPLILAELLSERLDRLPGGRRMAQSAACIGRPFATDLIAAILGEDAAAVLTPLESLVDAEVLLSKRQGGETLYEFRHALLRRMAYESMVQVDRRAMHRRIVDVLRARQQVRPPIPEVVAHHLTEAGIYEEAVEAWLLAGVTAGRASAHVEAVGHLRKGLSLIDKLPSPERRRQLELNVQVALMSSILATQSATSPELSACCDRGISLCEEGEPNAMIFPFVFGQFTHVNCRGRIAEAEQLAHRFLAIAQRASNESARVIGHRMLGMALLAQGDAVSAKAQLETSLNLYVRERDEPTTHMFGQNTEIHTKSLLSLTHFCLGEVEAALDIGVDALRTADSLRHPHSTGIPLIYVGGWVFGLCDATNDLVREARRLIGLAEQHRLAGFRAHGMAFLGWGMCQRGTLAQGIAAIEQGIAAFESVNFHLALAGHVANLADAQRRAGRILEAESSAARALDLVPEGSLWLESEVRRVQALVVRQLSAGHSDRAESMLVEAAMAAKNRGFPVLEWRCLVSLRQVLSPQRFESEFGARSTYLEDFSGLGRLVAQKTSFHVGG